MCANDRSITELVSNEEGMERRSVLERAAAIGATGTLLGVTSDTARAHSEKSDEKPNRIVLKAVSDGKVKVRIKVDGEIEKGRLAGESDTIRDSNVAISRIDAEHAPGARDSFRFSGEITEFEVLEGDVKVILNGEEVDPDTLGEPELPHRIVLKAMSDGDVKVRIKVDGEIEKGRFAGESDEILDNNVAISRMDEDNTPGAIDSFRFSGDVVEFMVKEGGVNVFFTVAEADSDDE